MVRLVGDVFVKYINKYRESVMQGARVHALPMPSPQKWYDVTNDYNLTVFVAKIIRNKRYFVELLERISRCRI